MNFEELGLTLQREREKKGLTVEAVMEATKISRTNIVAMESGDQGSLPHPVYAKGFIKSYARFLGLDADELSMVVDREFQDEDEGPEEKAYEVAPDAEKAFHDKDAGETKGKSAWPLMLVLVLLVAGAVFLVMNLGGDDEKPEAEVVAESVEETAPPTPARPESVEEEGAADVEHDVNVSEQPVEEEAARADTETTDLESAVQSEKPQEEVEEPASESVAASKPEPTPEPEVEPVQEAEPETKPVEAVESQKPKYDHMLVIQATTEKGCWIGVWKGDEAGMSRDFVLKKGEPLRLMFNTPRRIRIGNVAGVTVTYNGEPYALDDARGNIQTLRFGME